MNQKGYALPVVMAISMIIVIMTLSIAFSTRQKIAMISELKDQGQARLKSYSALNEVLYNMLTSNFTPTGIKIYLPDGKWKIWNLYGEPIALDDSVSVKLRDVAGMVSPVTQPGYLAALLSGTSASTAGINSFLDKLADWQDADDLKRLNGAEAWDYQAAGYSYTPRNFYIQTIDEIRLIKDFDDSLFDAVRGDIVYWGSDHVNYLTMSDKMLHVLLKNDKTVDALLKMRGDHVLTGDYFSALTGIPRTEMVFPAPSGFIRIEVTARQNEAVDTIGVVVAKRETHTQPYMVLEWNR
ncbi:MAG: general secretion pathway protein GspK [Deltaproteobacteria bacterium]|nr:general secretion pathway protein GspK [Deltaproteobacteria bacterium]